ncbi:MAG: hypothetical protein PVI63_02550 [Anaerolineae bacterium]
MISSSGRNDDSHDRRVARPAGSMIGVAIPIGAGFGVALGLVLDNLALGIAIGSAMGAAIGAAMEQKRRGAAPDTYWTRRRRLWVLLGAGLTLLLGLAALAAFLLAR